MVFFNTREGFVIRIIDAIYFSIRRLREHFANTFSLCSIVFRKVDSLPDASQFFELRVIRCNVECIAGRGSMNILWCPLLCEVRVEVPIFFPCLDMFDIGWVEQATFFMVTEQRAVCAIQVWFRVSDQQRIHCLQAEFDLRVVEVYDPVIVRIYRHMHHLSRVEQHFPVFRCDTLLRELLKV